MKKCPFCGADIEESAVFCLYCMSRLNEKSDIIPSRPKGRRRVLLIVIIAAVLALVCTAVLLVVLTKREGGEGDESQSAGEEYASSDTAVGEASAEKITSFEDFALRVLVSSHKTDSASLWDPDSIVLTHTGTDSDGDEWQIYSADSHIDGVNVRFDFCNDGEEIITRITSLTKDNFDDGVKIAHGAVAAVYNYTFTNLTDLLTDHSAYPMNPINDGETISVLSELPDPEARMTDSGTTALTEGTYSLFDVNDSEKKLLFYQLRKRIYHGVEYFDIFILHTTE